MHNWF